MALTFDHLAARSGRTRSLVIMLHGFGSNGAAMMPLSSTLSVGMPDTDFISPDAPIVAQGNPEGRKWYSIPELDGTTAEESYSCMKQASEELDRFVDEQSQKSGVPPSSIALVGFSQGAGLCFENAPRRRARLAGVVAIAGRMKAKDTLIAESRSRPPFLVLTGAKDRLLDSAETEATILSLTEAGIQVKHRIMADTGHAISDGGIAATLAFLTHVLA